MSLSCKTKFVGRFESTVEFYSRYREPYPARFFPHVAEQLGFGGSERLLDVGCGPGLLAIGFAPFVGEVTALDPEPAMMAAARAAAAEAHVEVSFVHGRLEQFSTPTTYDIVAIGRALHWLDRQRSLPMLERLLPTSGRILICGASSRESPDAPWVKTYDQVRRSYADDPDEQRYLIKGSSWFTGSCFALAGEISITERREVTIPELIGRALSKSNTSPAVIGERRAAFEDDIREAVEPFARKGVLEEEIVARATLFARPAQ